MHQNIADVWTKQPVGPALKFHMLRICILGMCDTPSTFVWAHLHSCRPNGYKSFYLLHSVTSNALNTVSSWLGRCVW